MKNMILLLSVLLSSTVFAKTETKSIYTDLEKDCIVVSQSTKLAPIDFYESECKSFAGYALKESGGDLRYGPRLSFGDYEIDLQRPANFHGMGSKKIEWVYDISQDEEGGGTLNFKALIYRLSVANSESGKRDNSILYVVRLNGQKSCLIGTTKTNEDACRLANDKSAKCVEL